MVIADTFMFQTLLFQIKPTKITTAS